MSVAVRQTPEGEGLDFEVAHRSPRPVAAPLPLPERRLRSDDGPLRSASVDALEAYLREIGRVPLLTADEEKELAFAMADGLAAEEALAGDPHADDAPVLRLRARRGQSAKARLIEANLRLVVSVAKRYRGQGMQLVDLVQEGNFGLMRAVEKFDPSRGFKLSTYATWWIRQNIARALADRDRTVRLPIHVLDSVHVLRRVQSELVQTLQRQPTAEDVAAWMGMPAEEVHRLLDASAEPLSLDVPIGEKGNAQLSDLIEDPIAMDPISDIATAELGSQLRGALGAITGKERQVIAMRFGLEDGRPKTLDQVGDLLGLSRESVRHLERKTMCKLRHPCTAHHLRDFLES